MYTHRHELEKNGKKNRRRERFAMRIFSQLKSHQVVRQLLLKWLQALQSQALTCPIGKLERKLQVGQDPATLPPVELFDSPATRPLSRSFNDQGSLHDESSIGILSSGWKGIEASKSKLATQRSSHAGLHHQSPRF
jgi:hypothetical protein